MTTRTRIAVMLTLLVLFAVTMTLRTPVPLAAQASTPGQRPNLAVPHQDAPAPAVLALSIQGRPTLVGPEAPVPVALPTPVPVTLATPVPVTLPTTPVIVSDGGQVITATGDYTFVFASTVTLPKMAQPVGSLPVRVVQISGKWVTADYAASQGSGSVRMVFNTQTLLGFSKN